MLTDSHCHLASHKFQASEIPDLITRARDQGVHRLITLSTDETDLPLNLDLAQKYPQIHACLGIHPCDVTNTRDDFESLITPHLADPRVAAIGETGLDYFHPAPEGWLEDDYHHRQRDFLRRHFELAAAAQLNVVIHTRDRQGQASFEDALEIYAPFSNRVRAVFHCFPGPPELAQRIFDLGGLVSFTGIATFKNAHAVIDTIKAIPPSSFMIETDAPYLAPTPHRGERCEPAFTRLTAETVASLRQSSIEDLAKETEEVVTQFFRLTS